MKTRRKIILIPANIKHWHGAKKNSWFSHIAVEVPGEDCTNEWKMQYDMEERALSEGESITYKTWEHKENILRVCRERTLMGLHTV